VVPPVQHYLFTWVHAEYVKLYWTNNEWGHSSDTPSTATGLGL